MKIAIIHNNNLPDSIINLAYEDSPGGHQFKDLVFSQATSDVDDIDTFLSKRIDDQFKEYAPDMVILPMSLSVSNPLEYTGVRCAALMRASELEHVCTVPFLFLDPNDLEDAMRMAGQLGTFLVTPGVFCSKVNSGDGLLEWIGSNQEVTVRLDADTMIRCLDRFSVAPPANYGDSHHAVTNIWSMIRWNEMISWDRVPEPVLGPEAREFSNCLYSKWVMKTLGEREHFKKKKISACIPLIWGKKIVHIDDEYSAGWGELFKGIFSASKACYVPFTDFSKSDDRSTLVDKIKAFVDLHSDADCFLIDLRLHEKDHGNNDYGSLTGHVISEYIYDKNHGNQIVVFTASDKIGNYVKAQKYFSGYVIKENPMRSFTKNESKAVFDSFAHAIQKACRQSYLKEYYEWCGSNPYLGDFFEILRTDDETNSVRHSINLRSAALNLMVYIESTIKDNFEIIGTDLRQGSNVVGKISDIFIESKKDESGGRPMPTQMGIFSGLRPSGDWEQKLGSDIFLICSALYMFYGLVLAKVNEVIDLKNIRNTAIAHGSSPSNVRALDLELLRRVFEDVVVVMVKKTSFN